MIKKLLVATMFIALISCDQEEVSQPITKENITFILTSGEYRNWIYSSEDVDKCSQTDLIQFTNLVTDTGMVFLLDPIDFCADTIVSDTLNQWQWVISDTTDFTVFDGYISFIEEESVNSVKIEDITPLSLQLLETNGATWMLRSE